MEDICYSGKLETHTTVHTTNWPTNAKIGFIGFFYITFLLHTFCKLLLNSFIPINLQLLCILADDMDAYWVLLGITTLNLTYLLPNMFASRFILERKCQVACVRLRPYD